MCSSLVSLSFLFHFFLNHDGFFLVVISFVSGISDFQRFYETDNDHDENHHHIHNQSQKHGNTILDDQNIHKFNSDDDNDNNNTYHTF
jgi:hypothetical protein